MRNKNQAKSGRKARVTLDQVAKAAGVSTATVSRTLNTPEAVAVKVRARVHEQITQLGYVRDGNARALASKQSRMIGAIIPTLESAIFASGMNAIEKHLDQAGFSLLIAVSNYDSEHELKQIREMIEQGADGIILIGNDHSKAAYDLLEQHHQLFVNIWAYDAESDLYSIGFDNYAASRELTNYLIGLGHKDFAVIAGITKNNDRAQQRVSGVKDALKEHQIELESDNLIESPYDVFQARTAARRLLQRPAKKRPSAIICGNDVIAFGCLFECQHLGISVPQDISITGFDNLPLSEHLLPSLTTINIPTEAMGREAAEFMLASLKGEAHQTKIELPTELLVRESTAPPRPK